MSTIPNVHEPFPDVAALVRTRERNAPSSSGAPGQFERILKESTVVAQKAPSRKVSAPEGERERSKHVDENAPNAPARTEKKEIASERPDTHEVNNVKPTEPTGEEPDDPQDVETTAAAAPVESVPVVPIVVAETAAPVAQAAQGLPSEEQATASTTDTQSSVAATAGPSVAVAATGSAQASVTGENPAQETKTENVQVKPSQNPSTTVTATVDAEAPVDAPENADGGLELDGEQVPVRTKDTAPPPPPESQAKASPTQAAADADVVAAPKAESKLQTLSAASTITHSNSEEMDVVHEEPIQARPARPVAAAATHGAQAESTVIVAPAPTDTMAATEAVAPKVSPEHLRQVTVDGVRMLVSRGGKTISVQLVPESLGELRLEVSSAPTGNGVHVRLISANAEVRDALAAQLPSLKEALTRTGVETTHVVVASEAMVGQGMLGQHQSGNTASSYDAMRQIVSPAGQPVKEENGVVQSMKSQPAPHSGVLNVFV